MINKEYKRFFFISLAALLVLSAYPLVNGARMAFLSVVNGAIAPEHYAKYIVPYTAMCCAVILFAAFQPLLFKAGRFALPVGFAGTFAVFITAELLIERIRLRTDGMSLVDAATFSINQAQSLPSATVDAWQASLCIASPPTVDQSVQYALQDRYLYIMANNTYKIHYYLIALILISMICGLVYGIGRMLRSGDRAKTKPLILQGISTAALTALCVFANTTGFFRQTEAIQTPLASVLTCLFFVVLGAAVGVYIGSFLLGKGRRLGIRLPVFVSIAAVLLMFFGEAAMMEGGLYRFGTCWFFDGLPFISLAPADILVILLAGGTTWLILRTARRKGSFPGKLTTVVSLIVCAIIAVSGIGFSMADRDTENEIVSNTGDVGVLNTADDIFGCYTFSECLYMNPLSSVSQFGGLPYVYGIGAASLIIANTGTGDIAQFPARYEKTPVAEDELSSKADFMLESFPYPHLSLYKERWLHAAFIGEGGQQYRLYQMDGDIWLVQQNGDWLWSIYKLQKTDKTTLADLERAFKVRDGAPEGLPQMTLNDVYDLARNGESLTLRDFNRFDGKAVGSGFMIMRYDIEGGCVLIVHCDTPDSAPNYARLSKRGYDPFDEALTVDIRAGTQAVAAYMNILHTLTSLKIEDSHGGTGPRELIYEFDDYKYYLNTTRADGIFITFDNGDRLPLKKALEERRLIIEDAVANGLSNVFMVPSDNPLGGEFTILHHLHTFAFDNEAFYPSASFMYVVYENGFSTYFDAAELADILALQGRSALAGKLRQISTDKLPVIVGKAYITDAGLADAGIVVEIGWALSSHTPVSFTSTYS